MALNPPAPKRLPKVYGSRGGERNAITAAAEKLSRRLGMRGGAGGTIGEEWQKEVWEYYRRVPELRAACRISGRAMGQCRLVLARLNSKGEPAPLDFSLDENGQPNNQEDWDHPARKMLAAFAGGQHGQTEILDAMGVALTAPGEIFLIGSLDQEGRDVEDEFTRMQAYSTSQVTKQADKVIVKLDDSRTADRPLAGAAEAAEDPTAVVAIRVWRPDPEFNWKADSAAHSALGVLREIAGYDDHIEATILSRLAGAGVLWVPDEIDLPGVEAEDETDGDGVDPFLRYMMEIMSLAMKDRRSAAALTPILARAAREDIEAIRHMTFSTPFDEKVTENREKAVGRLGVAVDMPGEVLLGLGSLQSWCVDEETEILSRRGWLIESELVAGDEVWTLNHDTGLGEWGEVRDIFRQEVEDYPMVKVDHQYHSSLTTLNHKWPLLSRGSRWREKGDRVWSTSFDMVKHDVGRIPVVARQGDAPEFAKYTDDFVLAVAAFFSDGTWGSGQITTAKAPKIAEVRRVLASAFGEVPEAPVAPTVFTLRETHLSALRECLGEEKELRIEFIESLTIEQRRLFLQRLPKVGDGERGWSSKDTEKDSWNQYGLTITQSSLARSESLALLAATAGYRVLFQTKFNGDAPAWTLNISFSEESTPFTDASSLAAYTGTIWCPVTPNQTWFARRNGKTYFTGNTGALVTDEWKGGHLAELMGFACSAITYGWLYKALVAAGHGDLESDIIVWYDDSSVRTRENTGPEVQAAYDRGEINGDALRRVLGYDESDKPTEDEFITQVSKILLLKNPSLAPLLMPLFDFEFTEEQLAQSKVLKDLLAPGPSEPEPVGPTSDGTYREAKQDIPKEKGTIPKRGDRPEAGVNGTEKAMAAFRAAAPK